MYKNKLPREENYFQIQIGYMLYSIFSLTAYLLDMMCWWQQLGIFGSLAEGFKRSSNGHIG